MRQSTSRRCVHRAKTALSSQTACCSGVRGCAGVNCHSTVMSVWARPAMASRPRPANRSCSVMLKGQRRWRRWMWHRATGLRFVATRGEAVSRRRMFPSRSGWYGEQRVRAEELPTAPVMAGGLTFVADRSGVVQAYAEDGSLRWSTPLGGPVFYPPTIVERRLLVGCRRRACLALEAATGRLLWSYRSHRKLAGCRSMGS